MIRPRRCRAPHPRRVIVRLYRLVGRPRDSLFVLGLALHKSSDASRWLLSLSFHTTLASPGVGQGGDERKMICSPRVMQTCSWALSTDDVTCRRVPREGRPVHIDRQTDAPACGRSSVLSQNYPVANIPWTSKGRVGPDGPRPTKQPSGPVEISSPPRQRHKAAGGTCDALSQRVSAAQTGKRDPVPPGPRMPAAGQNGRTMGWLTSAVLTAWRRVALPA